jgi:hypothetical protein
MSQDSLRTRPTCTFSIADACAFQEETSQQTVALVGLPTRSPRNRYASRFRRRDVDSIIGRSGSIEPTRADELLMKTLVLRPARK